MADTLSLLASTIVFVFSGGSNPAPLGTAFIVGYPVPSRPAERVSLIVTAKHVIGERDQVILRFTPKGGDRVLSASFNIAELRRAGDLWEHPDEGVDLVVFRSPHFNEVQYATVDLSLIASRQIFTDQRIAVTQQVVFPSLIPWLTNGRRNYPLMRTGFISLLPEEDIALEYNIGEQHIATKQPLLLIDTLAVQGASGAPIFVTPNRLEGKSRNTPWLIGIVHGFQLEKQGDTITNSGVTLAFPSWRLLEVLNSDRIAKRITQLLSVNEK